VGVKSTCRSSVRDELPLFAYSLGLMEQIPKIVPVSGKLRKGPVVVNLKHSNFGELGELFRYRNRIAAGESIKLQ
jgi:hypothetical protein